MAPENTARPVALTIAGSDSGGGAGIQADLKTFAALGTYGTSALTAITAQNPEGVTAIQAVEPHVVHAQIRAVADYFAVGAAKMGMLFSTDIIHAVADAYRATGRPGGKGPPPLVVDPVMVATSGAKLLNDDAIEALRQFILPVAAVVTPNMDEAALLAGHEVASEADLQRAAESIFDRHGVPVLVKGGHLKGTDTVVDCLYDGMAVQHFRAPFITAVNTHGSGCTLSSAIAVYLLRGLPLAEAVAEGRRYLRLGLERSVAAGADRFINHGFAPEPVAGEG